MVWTCPGKKTGIDLAAEKPAALFLRRKWEREITFLILFEGDTLNLCDRAELF